jgi:hypothetical protein
MKKITNSYVDLEVINLDPGGKERGPFLVVQTGYVPGDLAQRERHFALRPDGKWVEMAYYQASNNPDALEEVLFDTTAAIMELLGSLPLEPDILDLPVSDEGLRAFLARIQGSNGLEATRRWVLSYKERHRQQA